MGEPKSRKPKSKTVDAEQTETDILQLPVEDANETEGSKTKSKKKKKSKALEMSTEEINDRDNVSESEEAKPKNKKKKGLDVSTVDVDAVDEIEENTPKTKKNKKRKGLDVSTVDVDAVDENEENTPKTKKNKKRKGLDVSTVDVDAVDENEENTPITKKKKKNKKKEPSTEELSESQSIEEKTKRAEKHKLKESSEEDDETDENKPKKKKKKKNPPNIQHMEVPEEFLTQYPLLADKALAEKFNAVIMKTHMRSRQREQIIKKLRKTPPAKLPEAMHRQAQSILASPEQSENDLRRVRLLVNMLKSELIAPGTFRKGLKGEAPVQSVNGEGAKNVPVPNLDLPEDVVAKYPVLNDGALLARFRALTMSNNTKGRIRQLLKDSLKGTSETLLPDVINTRMQAILKSEELTIPKLKKLKVLYNMLRTSLLANTPAEKKPKQKKKKPKEKKEKESDDSDEEGEKQTQKVKGPKRYVVFVGNLPLGITEEKLAAHFELGDSLRDVRLPAPAEDKKSAIAYLELADELTFELALSKNHSMLDNKRINVSYTTQQNSKISKTEAKGKAAKLSALQKAGKLAGSVPLNRKRSARRNKMRAAQKEAENAA